VVRSEGESLEERMLSALTGPTWSCEVESREEVLDFLRRWGNLPVVRA